MIAQITFLSALLTLAQAGHLGGSYGGSHAGFGGGTSYSSVHSIPIASHKPAVEYYAPPKYEFKYGVEDPHTGDWKQQDESRVNDLTQSNYVLAEKDRKISVNRIIAGAVPIPVSKGW